MTTTSSIPLTTNDVSSSNYGSTSLKQNNSTIESLSRRSSSMLLEGQPSQHLGSSRQYWRDIILGVNDGLISTFLLVTGVAGGGLTSTDILLTAIAGALAGAVSMFAGEYVATKSQNEVLDGEIQLEQYHIRRYKAEEVKEVRNLLILIGITDDQEQLRNDLLVHYENNPDALLQIMKRLEFGIVDEEKRSPIKAGLVSCLLFFSGSLPSIIPFIFSGDYPTHGLIWATICTISALFVVGAIKTWATRGNCCTSAVENLVIAGFGGILAYTVGLFFDSIIR